MNLVSVLGICIIASAVSVLLKRYNLEYSLLISLVAGGIVLILLITAVSGKLREIENIALQYSAAPYFWVAIKALAIALITGFVADVCRESGQLALASKAEFAGRCAIFILSVPMLLSLLDTAYEFIF